MRLLAIVLATACAHHYTPGELHALARTSDGEVNKAALAEALHDPEPWVRARAARAWGRRHLPASALSDALRDPDWRVRVGAARGLGGADGGAAAFAAALKDQTSPHVLVALFESAAQLGEPVFAAIPDPSTISAPWVRCAAAQARDRIRKQLKDTPMCDEPGWRNRARTGALAAELGLAADARAAFHDEDGRVRGAAAGAASEAFAADLLDLLADPDPFVVQEAAGTLSKPPFAHFVQNSQRPQEAIHRLEKFHEKPAGVPESDALTALVALTGPQPQLLPTPNAPLAAALKQPLPAIPVPNEARLMPNAKVLRIKTNRGELVANLRTDVAPLTSSAIAALAARHFYDGLTFHRVVPDFVIQGGDPRGDGDGGPGWALPDEHSSLHFLRGTMGIATSGPNTGGSQFFFCHSPQPHLDGNYTIAGQLWPESLDVLDQIQPGDTIVSTSIE